MHPSIQSGQEPFDFLIGSIDMLGDQKPLVTPVVEYERVLIRLDTDNDRRNDPVFPTEHPLELPLERLRAGNGSIGVVVMTGTPAMGISFREMIGTQRKHPTSFTTRLPSRLEHEIIEERRTEVEFPADIPERLKRSFRKIRDERQIDPSVHALENEEVRRVLLPIKTKFILRLRRAECLAPLPIQIENEFLEGHTHLLL